MVIDDSDDGSDGAPGDVSGSDAVAARQGAPLRDLVTLARGERDAMMRALAGRLAHQMRNPLAAIRAVCSGLRSEVEDADQHERLDLALQEIDRMLGFVAATVQGLPYAPEPHTDVDLRAELTDIAALVGRYVGNRMDLRIEAEADLACRLPRQGLRVAVFSVLDHLAGEDEAGAIELIAHEDHGRAMIQFVATGSVAGRSRASGPLTAFTGAQVPTALLVAERFARDTGGRLLHAGDDGHATTIVLQLPCTTSRPHR